MSILDLPIELLQDVAYRIPSDHKRLRTVCKSLNFVIAPSFFSSIALDVQPSRLEFDLSQLEALAAGKSPWSRFARTLKIGGPPSWPLGRGGDDDSRQDSRTEPQLSNSQLIHILRPALEALKNVCTVKLRWTDHDEVPQVTMEAVAFSLGSLPLLTDFQLSVDRPEFTCSFDGLSGLRKLSITSSLKCRKQVVDSMAKAVSNSPDLTSLHLLTPSYGHLDGSLSFFNHLFTGLPPTQPLRLTDLHIDCYSSRLDGTTISHLRCLQSIRLHGPWDKLAQRVWGTLRAERIHLTEIHATGIEEGLLDYLSAYSGLERLTIDSAGGTNEAESNRRADLFFERALPHHENSLMKLSCFASYEGRWSLGAHNVTAISRLHKLTSLGMSVNSVCKGYASQDGDGGGGGSSRGRTKVMEIESNLDGRNTVHLFLVIAELPSVQEAVIRPARTEKLRNSWRGNASMAHKQHVTRLIDEAVRKFTSGVQSAALVLAGLNYYKMRDGTERYHAQEPAVFN
ncbi:hypothetical protein C8R44DRAFT_984514 [Mycena epipterygia]|nr:hypothetical protein C8R44DRAFT_984514 [Mycena epipterygia]